MSVPRNTPSAAGKSIGEQAEAFLLAAEGEVYHAIGTARGAVLTASQPQLPIPTDENLRTMSASLVAVALDSLREFVRVTDVPARRAQIEREGLERLEWGKAALCLLARAQSHVLAAQAVLEAMESRDPVDDLQYAARALGDAYGYLEVAVRNVYRAFDVSRREEPKAEPDGMQRVRIALAEIMSRRARAEDVLRSGVREAPEAFIPGIAFFVREALHGSVIEPQYLPELAEIRREMQ